MKEKSEYIIKENMHEPIISKELWNKVQEKLSSYNTDTRKKYEYPLKRACILWRVWKQSKISTQ